MMPTIDSTVRSFAALDERVAGLRRRALRTGHRAALVARPASPYGVAGAMRWIETRGLGARPFPRAGPDATARSSPDRAHRMQALLGTERDAVALIIAGERNIDPAELAGALGTLRAGGIAVLVVPHGPASRSVLARRLVERLRRAASAPGAPIAVADLAPDFGRRERGARKASAVRRPAQVHGRAAVPSTAAVLAQDALLERARQGLVRPGSTLVLLGARGRGKSALVGRLLDRVRTAPDAPATLVTSAVRTATTSIARHARTPIRFVAPDAALREPPATLVVDEAATLPAQSLAALLRRHDRAVLATTVDGHEASGRAFAVRLDGLLGPGRVGATILTATHPMRWREDDPLERALGRALLLDAMSAGVPPPSPRPETDVRIRFVPAARWRADEGALRELVRLLAGTHYQSGLRDLEHLLDGTLDVYVARAEDGALAGAALVAREGGIDARYAGDILAGTRRLPDQLLPQLLARAAGDAAALGARYARVVRIAVDPARRRAGVGSRLLREIGAGVDAVGASFAAEDGASRFWRANGYRHFHEGRRVNPRSGTTSRTVLRPTGEPAPSPPRGAVGDETDELQNVARRLVSEIRAGAMRHG